MKARKPFALVVTGAWAKGVKAYWDNVAKEEAKAKVVEERRSKVMAKEVLRTVLAEWARVVIVSFFGLFFVLCGMLGC